jgi:hypothetical protein
MTTGKNVCQECNWHGVDADLLRAQNPFANDSEEMIGCPQCREPNSMRPACDEPDCWEPYTCGTPIPPDGYRCTCSRHKPRRLDMLQART